MAWFRDKLSRRWDVEVTMGSALQVEQDLGIDLLKWIEDGSAADNRTVFKIVGSLVADQIAAQGLDLKGFAAGFDGAALERAGAALVEALLFFSQPQRVARAALPKMLEAIGGMHDRMVAAIEGQDFRNWAGPLPVSVGSTPGPSPSASSGTPPAPAGSTSGTEPPPS